MLEVRSVRLQPDRLLVVKKASALIASLALAASVSLSAQDTSRLPSFEVASITESAGRVADCVSRP